MRYQRSDLQRKSIPFSYITIVKIIRIQVCALISINGGIHHYQMQNKISDVKKIIGQSKGNFFKPDNLQRKFAFVKNIIIFDDSNFCIHMEDIRRGHDCCSDNISKSFILINFLLIISSVGSICQSKENIIGIEGGGGG